jgi:hypothetical protein
MFISGIWTLLTMSFTTFLQAIKLGHTAGMEFALCCVATK